MRGPNLTSDLPELRRLRRNLARLLKRRKMSGWELARLSGVSQPIISRILRGDRDNPQLATLLRLCRALGVGVGDLVTAR